MLGENGAGKTTLLKLLCGLIIPTSGRIFLEGRDVTRHTAPRGGVGIVTSDERSLFWRLSGRENLRFFAALYGIRPDRVDAEIDRVLALVQLQVDSAMPVGNYSSGAKQKLAIARALLHRPSVLLLDEPTKTLDHVAARAVHDLLRGAQAGEQGTAIVFATHRLEEAKLLADRILILHRGQVHWEGATGQLSEMGHPGQGDSSLEELTAQIYADEPVARGSQSGNPAWLVEPIRAERRTHQEDPVVGKLISWKHKPLAFVRRDFLIAKSYKSQLLFQTLGYLFTAILFYYIAQLFKGFTSAHLVKYGGDYFAFLLVSLGIGIFLTAALAGVPARIRDEQMFGTLEAVMVTPTSPLAILLFSNLFNLIVAFVQSLVYLSVAVALFSPELAAPNYAVAAISLLLVLVAFPSLGVVASSFVLVFKRGAPLNFFLVSLAQLLGGAFFPITVLPLWLRAFSYALPVTYTLELMRRSLLTSYPPAQAWSQLVVLFLFTVTAAALAVASVPLAVRKAKQGATLGQY